MNIFREFLRSWSKQPGMQLATLTVLTGTFTVIAVFMGLQQNLGSILSRWGETVQITAYLEDRLFLEEDIDEHIDKLKDDIRSYPATNQVEFVSKEKAVERFQKRMGTYVPDILGDESLGSPLPASLEIQLNQSWRNPGQFDALVNMAGEIAKLVGVEEVSYGQDWVKNYASVVGFFNSSSSALIVLLLAGSLLVVGNSIRSSIYQRREEIEILELVGATPRMIRAPYLMEGALMGFLAAGLALIIAAVLAFWQIELFTENLGFLGLSGTLGYLGLARSLGVLLLGIVFGLLGSYFCVWKISRGQNRPQDSWGF